MRGVSDSIYTNLLKSIEDSTVINSIVQHSQDEEESIDLNSGRASVPPWTILDGPTIPPIGFQLWLELDNAVVTDMHNPCITYALSLHSVLR
jgi:hypothetical protein